MLNETVTTIQCLVNLRIKRDYAIWSSFCTSVNGTQLVNNFELRKKEKKEHVIPVPVMYVILSDQLASCGPRLFQPHRSLGRGPKPVQEPDWRSLCRSSLLTWCQHWDWTHSLTKKSLTRTFGGALFWDGRSAWSTSWKVWLSRTFQYHKLVLSLRTSVLR